MRRHVVLAQDTPRQLGSSNGSLIGDGSNTYGYDVENRLVRQSGGHDAALAYDPLGRLWQVTSPTGAGAVTTTFLYDGDALVADYNGAAMLHRYAHWEGADVPMIAYNGATLDNPRNLLSDHQGSIVTLSDANGNATLNRYDEYGIPAATNTGRFQYTGQVWLGELGLYSYKSRLYSPTLGRFMQTDAVGYADQFNLYEYVGDDPVNRSDPTGQYECDTTKACATAARGVAEIRAARDFYRSPGTGSRISRAASAAGALDRVLSSLGTRGDGGVNIATGDLGGNDLGVYDSRSNTITLDRERTQSAGSRIGQVLGHEAQHYIERDEDLSPLAAEVRPLAIEYMIGIAPGGSISGMSGTDYVRNRLNFDYCRLPAQYCNPGVARVMNDELAKPF